MPAAAPPEPASPSAVEVWRLASLGRSTPAATVAWIRVVARFTRSGPGDAAWLLPALEPVAALDPRWTTPHVYGALMARHLGDHDAQQQLLRRAIDAFPQEPWFPYALGMARYLDHDDLQGAAEWLERAAALPDAPPVHAEAARAMRARLAAPDLLESP